MISPLATSGLQGLKPGTVEIACGIAQRYRSAHDHHESRQHRAEDDEVRSHSLRARDLLSGRHVVFGVHLGGAPNEPLLNCAADN